MREWASSYCATFLIVASLDGWFLFNKSLQWNRPEPNLTSWNVFWWFWVRASVGFDHLCDVFLLANHWRSHAQFQSDQDGQRRWEWSCDGTWFSQGGTDSAMYGSGCCHGPQHHRDVKGHQLLKQRKTKRKNNKKEWEGMWESSAV